MDKNFFLAIALAFLVMFGYQTIFVTPKHNQALKNTQTIDNIKDTTKIVVNSASVPKNVEIPTETSIKAEISEIKTTTMVLKFSNVGGSLHNVEFPLDNKELPLQNMLTVKGFENAPFVLSNKTDAGLTYTYSDKDWKIVKTFSVKDKNTIKAQIVVKSLNDFSRLEDIKISTIRVQGDKVDPKNDRAAMLYEASTLENNKVFRKGNAYKFGPKDNRVSTGKMEWAGYREHYNMFIIKPEFETKAYDNEVLSEHVYSINVTPKDQGELNNRSVVYDFTIVGGKQDIEWLKKYGQKYEKIVAFFNWGVLDLCAKGIYYAVLAIHFICRNWGLSIILISLLIYGLTYPLTVKSMTSMKKMQAVQSKIKALQNKYKTEPQKLNAEMVELYKREGINPLGGCLPFLLQMPIFIALYQALWRSYFFQGESFLWVKDLAQPDRLFILPFNLPFLGNEFNILPLLMGGVMFIQQMITSKNMVVTDETQAMQQKMMKYFFPVFIAFIFYHFASGLSLYFTVFYALSAWAQWKVANPGKK